MKGFTVKYRCWSKNWIIREIEAKTKSMGFLFKPSKCRTFSICEGQPTNANFVLKHSEHSDLKVHMKSVLNHPYKFLGSKYYFEHYYKTIHNQKSGAITT